MEVLEVAEQFLLELAADVVVVDVEEAAEAVGLFATEEGVGVGDGDLDGGVGDVDLGDARGGEGGNRSGMGVTGGSVARRE